MPTYGRADLLEETLAALVPQVAALAGKVELCVCDDHSPDRSAKVIEKARKLYPFHFVRNEKNQGAIRNFCKVTAEMATGEYVWLIGQDDVPTPGAVQRLVAAIERNRELDYFYLNYEQEDPDGTRSTLCPWTEDRRVNRWQDLVQESGYLGTGMFVHVFRRFLWTDYWKKNPPGDDCAPGGKSHPQVNPHCYLVADHGIDRPAYYLAKPALRLRGGTATWHELKFPVFARHYPDILLYFRKQGLSPRAYRYNADWIFRRAGWVIREELNETARPGKEILLPFLSAYWREPRAWSAAVGAVLHSKRLEPLKKRLRRVLGKAQ